MTADPSIEERVRNLEDIEAVRRLIATYHQLCDGWTEAGTHRDPDAIAAVFADDGIWGVTARQPAPRGPEEIASMARELQAVPWIVHFVVNPIVDVDGDTARGVFKGVLRVRTAPGARMVWSLGIYTMDAVRTPAGWRIKQLEWEPTAGPKFDPADL